MSRALWYPILDRPALSVACIKLSSVNPGRASNRPLSNLVVDFSGSFLLQDRVAGRMCLIRLTPRLSRGRANSVAVRNELSVLHGNSDCDTSSSYCGDLGKFVHVVNFPLRRWVSFFGVIEFMHVRRHQDRVTQE